MNQTGVSIINGIFTWPANPVNCEENQTEQDFRVQKMKPLKMSSLKYRDLILLRSDILEKVKLPIFVVPL